MRRLVFIQRRPTVSRQRFNPQKLRQRSGDRLPGNTHRSVQNQPVRPCWSPVQQVSVAASHFFIHRLLLDVGGANPRCVCVHRDFLTAEDKEGVFNADHFPLWYKRAAEQVPGTFIYSIPFSTGENKTNILEQKDVWLISADFYILLILFSHLNSIYLSIYPSKTVE